MTLLQFYLLNVCVCMYVCMWVHTCYGVVVEAGGQRAGVGSLLPPCHHVGPSSRTQVVRLGCGCHCPLSHLTGPSDDSNNLNVR